MPHKCEKFVSTRNNIFKRDLFHNDPDSLTYFQNWNFTREPEFKANFEKKSEPHKILKKIVNSTGTNQKKSIGLREFETGGVITQQQSLF